MLGLVLLLCASKHLSIPWLRTFSNEKNLFICLSLSKWKWKWSRSVVSDSLRPPGLQPTRVLSPWDSPGKNTRVGCHFLLQGIFPTQGSNLGLLHCRQMLYPLSHQGSWKVYIYPLPFEPSSHLPPHPTPLGCYRARVWVPEPYSKFPLAIYFTYGNVSFHVTLSRRLTLSSPLPMSINLFSMSISPLLPCK